MLLSHINKRIIPSVLLASVLSFSFANANCDRRAFSIATSDSITLKEILDQLSETCKFSVVTRDAVAAENLTKNTNAVNIKDLTLREIFNILIKEDNMNYEYDGSSLKISALETRTFKIDYIKAIRASTAHLKATVDTSPREIDSDKETNVNEDNSILANETFDFWTNISDEITTVLNNGTERYQAVAPIINQNAGLVTVTGTKNQLDRVQKYVDSLQGRLGKQVMLDVSIIRVRLANSYSTGIKWENFKIGFNSYVDNIIGTDRETGKPIISTDPSRFEWRTRDGKFSRNSGAWTIGANLNFDIGGLINFLEMNGNAKTVSNPKVMTLNNQPAIITVGDVINYILLEKANSSDTASTVSEEQTQYSTFVGVLLNITPTISDDGKIMLRINPSLSNLKHPEDAERIIDPGTRLPVPRNIAPDTEERKISAVVTVNDGDTVILGGLIDQKKYKDQNSVPVLSSVPLIGNLFKNTEDRAEADELVFVITPRLMGDKAKPMGDSLRELGFSKSLYTYEQ